MRALKPIALALLALASAALVTGCGTSSAAPETPVKVRIAFNSRPDANAGAPLKVRIFMLRDGADFAAADFYSLQNRAAALLGESLIDQNALFLTQQAPHAQVTRTAPVGARYVGVIAEYQTLDRKTWRQLLPLPDAAPRPFYRFWRSEAGGLDARVTAGQAGLTLEPARD